MKTLVLGASTNPMRYSYLAINRLVEKGYSVVAIGAKPGIVTGIPVRVAVESFNDIDTVTLYVSPQRQKMYYDYILSLQPRRVIFNPGTENPELYPLLELSGIEVLVACTLVLLGTNQY